MSKCVATSVTLLAGLLVLSAPAAAEILEVSLSPGQEVRREFTITPAKFAELCAPLSKDQGVDWEFRATGETDFNIHFHVGERVEYPERQSRVSSARGRLAVGLDQDYCWMWTNRSTTPVVVTVKLTAASP